MNDSPNDVSPIVCAKCDSCGTRQTHFRDKSFACVKAGCDCRYYNVVYTYKEKEARKEIPNNEDGE